MSNLGPVYEGGDIDSITTENVESVVSMPDGTYITFRVHGREGFRTYRFRHSVKDLVEALPELAEFAEIL